MLDRNISFCVAFSIFFFLHISTKAQSESSLFQFWEGDQNIRNEHVLELVCPPIDTVKIAVIGVKHQEFLGTILSYFFERLILNLYGVFEIKLLLNI